MMTILTGSEIGFYPDPYQTPTALGQKTAPRSPYILLETCIREMFKILEVFFIRILRYLPLDLIPLDFDLYEMRLLNSNLIQLAKGTVYF